MPSLFHAVNPEAFYRYQKGLSVFIGAFDETKLHFYPFYKEPDASETEDKVYGINELIQIDDTDDLAKETRPYTELYAEFCARRADYPGAVTNEDLFSELLKLHAIIDHRRVTHSVTEKSGVVFKVTRDELDIAWDDELIPSSTYPFTDTHILPILPVFKAYSLCEKEMNY